MIRYRFSIDGPFYESGEQTLEDSKPAVSAEAEQKWDEKYISDLEEKRKKARAGGGEKRIASQRKKGKLTARERLEYLFDEGSFQEVGAFVESRFTDFGMKEKKLPGDGVITGFGTINGEAVYAAIEDFTVMGGTYGEYHSRKIVRIMDMAFQSKAPFITINESGDQPFEIFINTAKAGTEISAVSEAIGRLVSYVLRLASPVEPKSRLEEVAAQLRGIGGSRSLGFGAKRVLSLPDGLGHTFQEYLSEREERIEEQALLEELREGHKHVHAEEQAEKKPFEPATSPMLRIGDICPECGQATVINEEGCRKCYSCGYSEC